VFLDSGFAVVVLTNDQDADPRYRSPQYHECGLQFTAALRNLLSLGLGKGENWKAGWILLDRRHFGTSSCSFDSLDPAQSLLNLHVCIG
jgi:hypothetical protein